MISEGSCDTEDWRYFLKVVYFSGVWIWYSYNTRRTNLSKSWIYSYV